jgi:hypothetical protein
MTDPHRRTGRTTRMLQAAAAHGPGAHVAIVVPHYRAGRCLQAMCRELGIDDSGWRWFTPGSKIAERLRGTSLAGYYIDHSVYDLPLPASWGEDLMTLRACAL